MPVRGKNGGNRGQGSKWITRKRRAAIYARDQWRCVWCCTAVGMHKQWVEQAGVELATLDHVIPRDAGGDNKTPNLVTCCMRCNRERCSSPAYMWACALANAPNSGDSPGSILWRVIRAILKPLPVV